MDNFRSTQDEAQFLQAVMAQPTAAAVQNDNSALLFHVDAKMDHLHDRVENRNQRFQEDLIADLNQLKTKLRRQSRRTNFFAILTIVAGFTAAYFAIYGKVAVDLQKLIEQRAEHEFSSDKIQALIATEAEKFTKERAQTLIQSKMDTALHEVDALKQTMLASMKTIEQEQGDVSKLIEPNRTAASNKAPEAPEAPKATDTK